ncbi:MAG: DUF6179 domain-containing protein [Oscillospiraceae bacterium]
MKWTTKIAENGRQAGNMDEYSLIPFAEEEFGAGNLTAQDISLLQLKLWKLLSRRAGLYTMGDSSSVRVETARELLSSICFLLHLFLQENKMTARQLLDTDSDKLFAQSLEVAQRKIEQAKQLYQIVCMGAPDICSVSLTDTLKGIGRFFREYDYRYFAHRIPADIDYQLGLAVPDTMQGVLFIIEYLSRLSAENDFISRFQKDEIVALLRVYCEDYGELLVNLCEPVLTNAIGRKLLRHEVGALSISEGEQTELYDLLRVADTKLISLKINDAVIELLSQIGISQPLARDYISKISAGLAPRIIAAIGAKSVAGVFLCID